MHWPSILCRYHGLRRRHTQRRSRHCEGAIRNARTEQYDAARRINAYSSTNPTEDQTRPRGLNFFVIGSKGRDLQLSIVTLRVLVLTRKCVVESDS